MTKILCFSWNTDHTALCENGSGTNKDAYLNAGSKDLIEKSFFTLTKRQPCYNPLFFESIKAAIIEYTPDIVAISNEGDIESGTYFHSDFLPYNMENNLGFNKYRLLVRDKYQADDDNSLRMSIYVKSTGTSIQSIEINKSTLFNNYQCTSNLGSALVLQIKMSNDTIAFIDLQLAYQNQNSSSCIKEIETKLIGEAKYVFLMGDFHIDYELKGFDKLQNIKDERRTSNPDSSVYSESDEVNEPTYVESSTILNDKWMNETGQIIYTDDKSSIKALGYHNRIFFRTTPNIKCLLYKTIYGSPMLKSFQKNHLGVLGVYEIKQQEVIYKYLDVLDKNIGAFGPLPKEIFQNIASFLDCKSLISTCESAQDIQDKCSGNYDNLLRQSLNKTTGLQTRIYNRQQLKNLCHLSSRYNIGAGYTHSLILSNTGQVFAFGNNNQGQLGLGNNGNRNTPTVIPNLNNIIQVSVGFEFSLILSNEGQVYAFGINTTGQLGLRDYKNRNNPTLIENLPAIIQISAGKFHSLILSKDGQAYSFGHGESGQLGLRNENSINIPTLIRLNDNIIQVSAGVNHSLVLVKDGYVYAFGRNNGNLGFQVHNGNAGQLGLGDNLNRSWPDKIPGLNNIVQVSAGNSYSLVLTNEGKVLTFGYNEQGQLGLGDHDGRNNPTLIENLSNIIQISAGGYRSLVLSDKGQMYAFGRPYAQFDFDSRPRIIPNSHNIIQLSYGNNYALILDIDGQVYGFGYNDKYQLGLGDTEFKEVPTKIMSIFQS